MPLTSTLVSFVRFHEVGYGLCGVLQIVQPSHQHPPWGASRCVSSINPHLPIRPDHTRVLLLSLHRRSMARMSCLGHTKWFVHIRRNCH